MKTWLNSSWLVGANQSYIEQLYEDFLINPTSIDAEWRVLFQKLAGNDLVLEELNSIVREMFRLTAINKTNYIDSVAHSTIYNYKQEKILHLLNVFRSDGHQYANLDPLDLCKKKNIFKLNPIFLGLTDIDLQESFNVDFLDSKIKQIKLLDLLDIFQTIYCRSIASEYMHIDNLKEKTWIQKRLESLSVQNMFTKQEKKTFLKELIAAESLEKYLGSRFPGAKRFSLEGGDALIPMLREIIRYTGKNDTKEIVIGMAHRGRLNVLINVIGKKSQDLFDEFTGKNKTYIGSGDVKYHMGFSSNIIMNSGNIVHLVLAFNPSHLEIINPVVVGSVRARLDRSLNSNKHKVLPVIIHGDAAIVGQGIVQETLNMSQVRGYKVGGTIHIVINNQVGFTTSNIEDARSTFYCTDIAKMVMAPIFHVNGDDLESVAFIVRLAIDYRNTFQRDVFIDLVCYRRHGHNESDEPSVTQPLMYQKIKQHPTLREIYSRSLEKEGIVTQKDIINTINSYRDSLNKGECMVSECYQIEIKSCSWFPYLKDKWHESYSTKVNKQHLQKLAICINLIPKNINIQSRVAIIYSNRLKMAKEKKPFDWGAAENLAYATIIDKGISIRLSGEDSARGTFFHRHAVIHDQLDGSIYVPLNHIHDNQGKFNVWDSVLSEEAALAFEYGYASTEPNILTIWEAQFGDFANGAQVVIDQFISSSEQKWNRICGLVMLLPHGYEGQGPEHSSARLERYLQLCAENNIEVCIPSTPAQIYHLLRRQVFRNIRRPLIVMSPKSLLRHPLAISTLDELSNGEFQLVIKEIDNLQVKHLKRVIMCTGKIYYDLLENRRKNKQANIAILRIEQLYPFPKQEIQEIFKMYAHVQDFIWCQEEPINQGAWFYSQHYFRSVIPFGATFRYICRPESAAPAVGYMSLHNQQQQDLINNALNVDN